MNFTRTEHEFWGKVMAHINSTCELYGIYYISYLWRKIGTTKRKGSLVKEEENLRKGIPTQDCFHAKREKFFFVEVGTLTRDWQWQITLHWDRPKPRNWKESPRISAEMVAESVTFALVTTKSILQNWTILVRKKYVSWRKNNTYNTWKLEAK